jgi:hypothetical protein
MIIFFGTPHRGAHWAEWAKKLTILSIGRVERRILDGLNVNSETLQRIASSFAVMVKEDLFKIVSFSEGLGISTIPGFTDKVFPSRWPRQEEPYAHVSNLPEAG